MSRKRTDSAPQMPKAQLQVFTKQQFNYKRNNSNLMSTCLTWNLNDQEDYYVEEQTQQYNRSQQIPNQTHPAENLNQGSARVQSYKKQQQLPRGKSATKTKQHGKPQGSNNYSKYEKTPQQIQQQRIKANQRKQKIINYIQSMVPYSRTLTDSKFQQFYQKSAPLAYGNANTNQLTGGVIYGNNLRTFNVNPHDYQNNPKYYQSYSTSLNFAHRTKRDESKHWKRLQKQLGKKLNLHQKNHTLQEGKQVVYVDVNDSNMYETMRENLSFKKQHRQQIRQQDKNYEHQKQMKLKAQKQKFLRQKAQNISQNLQKTQAQTTIVDRQQGQRLRQQIIYKHHDKDGKVRIGADRHALTCFVDINFPQNDSLYTEELIKRNPIYQTEVEDRHKNLAAHKRDNFEKSKSNVYPSHYLLPNSEQPQIQKMLVQKSRQNSIQKKRI